MNKLLKGSIAGAVGVALLLGGAGTFASWNNSAIVGSAGAIKAGTLTVTDPAPTTAGVWRNGPLASSPIIGTIANFRTVPGDTLTYTKNMTVTATGDNLKASLALDPTTIVASSGSTPADVALAGFLASGAAITATGTGVNPALDSSNVVIPGVYSIAPSATAVTVSVVVTLKFPNGAAAAENGAKVGSVNLSNLAVLLTQN
ncbi:MULTISPECIES: alternate-type signal peptide domain-containing protein [unclassified Cryobacterium]|uniref:alternate-type signal peptide domain-containing protein n=1 Tax=unclassified Cryobacterium TaxID=2649013 RepID=UPI002AB55E04|nr:MULTISPECIES: alternate-type signal peptide domain-containing protein [unclassified Cryobacterium]MDY7541682.1 alternate-type signal peptide domain-containing protein [Cryobacterium sp. 5B3]MEA9999063.1 alternate-type signal peptide domain-containing protein [Cryobacterium sp. RTS3]MEB0267224.1 alternate-type signal peptide domain-containing protein [Cryobacterium sp. 10I5]MEB0275464.1 alternate-type signal peptide domain-containing protein [Cryobacterium sp. 5B3]